MNSTRMLVYAALVNWATGVFGSAAIAQSYPVKPIRFIVPLAAGGNLDIVTRAVAQKVGEGFGQPSIVENRPGASSLVGTQFVAKAPPDGYTVLAMANTFVTAPSMISNTGYDPVKDFVGVSLTARIPNVLVVTTALPAKSVKELIALCKARPGELAYGSGGAGSSSHMAAELFARQAGVKLLHVPYKGNAPAVVDVIGGQIPLMFDQLSTSMQYINARKLRALGVTAIRRSPVYPDLPTIAEVGLPGYEYVTFTGIAVPTGTAREVLARLHAEIAKAVQASEIKSRFLQQAVELTASASSDEFTAFLRDDVVKTAKLVHEAGIKAE